MAMVVPPLLFVRVRAARGWNARVVARLERWGSLYLELSLSLFLIMCVCVLCVYGYCRLFLIIHELLLVTINVMVVDCWMLVIVDGGCCGCC